MWKRVWSSRKCGWRVGRGQPTESLANKLNVYSVENRKHKLKNCFPGLRQAMHLIQRQLTPHIGSGKVLAGPARGSFLVD